MKTKQIFLASAVAVAISAVLTSTPILAEPQATMNSFWWPEQLDLKPLRQNAAESNPLGKSFKYAEQFKTVSKARLNSGQNALEFRTGNKPIFGLNSGRVINA